MTAPTLNLDALDGFANLEGSSSAGKPLLLDLDLVHEDPAQPRKNFDDAKQQELNASIAVSGIRVPVSVRPHPSIPGHYMLNWGARRRRAAISVGLAQIPALIEDQLTDFDQVIENLQRADLTPMEMALFISGKQQHGMKAAEIARRLGLTPSAISKFFALVDAPEVIEAVYASGRTTSPDTLYALRRAYDRWPEETEAWLATDVDVTRRTVAQFKGAHSSHENGAVAVRHRSPKKTASNRHVRHPIVVVRVGDRIGTLVLTQWAHTDGHVLVKWDDNSQIGAAAADEIRIIRLDDARHYEPTNSGFEKETA